jgi:L-fuconolactonase
MRGLEIVDAQVHLWSDVAPEKIASSAPYRRINGGDAASPPVPFTPEDLLAEMDGAGVDRAVLVPSDWGRDDLGFALSAAARYPDRFGVVSKFDLRAEDGPARLANQVRRRGTLGVRVLLHKDPGRSMLADGALEWFWKAAQDADVPVMLQPHGSLPRVGEVARRYPALALIIDHLALDPLTGIGPVREDLIEPSIDALVAVAGCPNIAVKASCLPNYVSGPYPFKSLHGHIRRVIDAFGPERVFWGSDLSRLRCPYGELVTLFTEELGFLSEDDLEWVMGRGLRTWLRWI